MMPKVDSIKNNGDILTFTLSNTNVSVANALRRTIMSDIPSIVFRTAPYEESKAKIDVNTTRLNNEILKQRLSCIPIHMSTSVTAQTMTTSSATSSSSAPYKNYQLEIDVKNETDAMIYVTTKDFVVRDKLANKIINSGELFPPNDKGQYIDFVRLRPKISDEIPGEHLKLTCDFDLGTAKESGMFSQVSTCAYGNTPDKQAADQALAKKVVDWKTTPNADIDFESKNWLLLDGLRYFVPDSYDFTIQTIGVYTNIELVQTGCDVLIGRLQSLGEFEIKSAENTLKNSYDVILKDDDYTIGKTLEWFLYSKYFLNESKSDSKSNSNLLTYCGFKKFHPHDHDSTIRLAYKEPVVVATIQEHLANCIDDAIKTFTTIKKEFKDK
jgi:DNA-directed RNA polymerase alpha subunit